MERFRSWITRSAWPDVGTDEGLYRACAIGAAAQTAVGGTCVSFLIATVTHIHGFLDGVTETEIEAIAAFATAGLATCYLAQRILLRRCMLAAWFSFLWIGYQNVDAALGVAHGDSLTLLVLLFAAFQGTRACSYSL